MSTDVKRTQHSPITLDEVLDNCPKNKTIVDNLIIAWSKINNPLYKNIVCAISGGSDSDIMLDICTKCDKDKKIHYVWFDTGLEYQATKDHIKYLEEKYDIKIETYKAIKAIPTTCKEYGQPFLSKQVSEYIYRLQSHNFDFANGDRNFEILYKEYPKCKAALLWWCNLKEGKRFNISWNKYLKEFLIMNPPTFKISNKCCQYAKKDVGHKLIKENGYDLQIIGVRKAEGGIRATAYKNCFSSHENNNKNYDEYRPLFWYLDKDKEQYKQHCNINHSKCYTEYGLTRTG